MIPPLADLCAFLTRHGPMLLGGATVLLAAGGAVARLHRSPLHRQRLGELTIGAVLVWLAFACVPLPRVPVPWPETAPRPATESPEPRAVPAARVYAGPDLVINDALVRAIAEGRIVGAADSHGGPGRSVASADAEPKPATTARDVRQPSPDVASIPPVPAPTVPPLAAVYLVGAIGCLAWLAAGEFLLRRMARRGRRPEPWLAELFDSLIASRGASHAGPAPRLLVSDHCTRPLSCGLWRPTVILPRDCARRSNAAQVRHVLLHELGHVRQRDARGNALLNLALPLLYCHPLYWWVRSQVCLARELVADDWAAGRAADKQTYVADLVALARSHLRGRQRAGSVGAIGIFVFKSTTNFYKRMHMLIHRNQPLPAQCSAGWRLVAVSACAAALALSACFVGVTPARADDADPVAEALKAAEHATAEADDDAAGAAEQGGKALERATSVLEELAEDVASEATGAVNDLIAEKLEALSGELEGLADRHEHGDAGHPEFFRQLSRELADVAHEAHEDGDAFHGDVPVLGDLPVLGRLFRQRADLFRVGEEFARSEVARALGEISRGRDGDKEGAPSEQERDRLRKEMEEVQKHLQDLAKRLAEAERGRAEAQGEKDRDDGEKGRDDNETDRDAKEADRGRAEEARDQARERAERAREQAERQREQAQAVAERAREQAERQREQAGRQREQAQRQAAEQRQRAQAEAHAQRDRARDESRRSEAEARAHAEHAQPGQPRAGDVASREHAKAMKEMEAAHERMAKQRADFLAKSQGDMAKRLDEEMARNQERMREMQERPADGPDARQYARADAPGAGAGAGSGAGAGAGGRDRRGESPSIAVGRAELDLVNLATSYSDAVGGVRVARARFQRAEAAAKGGVQSSGELAVEQASLDSAEAKAELLRTIAEIALEGAKAELEVTRGLQSAGRGGQSGTIEAEGKVKILERILNVSAGGGEKGDSPRRQ